MTRSRPIVRITTNQLSARRDVISTVFLGKSVRTEAIPTPTSKVIGMDAASVWVCRSIRSNARAFRERSNAYRSIGKLDRALADTSEAVRLDPRDAKAFDNRGDVFVDEGQSDLAIQDYDEALRLEVLD